MKIRCESDKKSRVRNNTPRLRSILQDRLKDYDCLQDVITWWLRQKLFLFIIFIFDMLDACLPSVMNLISCYSFSTLFFSHLIFHSILFYLLPSHTELPYSHILTPYVFFFPYSLALLSSSFLFSRVIAHEAL